MYLYETTNTRRALSAQWRAAYFESNLCEHSIRVPVENSDFSVYFINLIHVKKLGLSYKS